MQKSACSNLTLLTALIRKSGIGVGPGRKFEMLVVRGGGCARRGAVLLEVVVSLGLLITGMALVGMQVNMGLETARASDLRTRALLLVDTKYAELAAGVLEPESDDDILVGDFGVVYPGFGWMMEFEQTETDNLLAVTLTISYDGELREKQIANPERESDLDEKDILKDGAVLAVVYRLWPKPADLNMARDYGVDLTELTEGGPGAEGEGEGGLGSSLLDRIAVLLAAHPGLIKSDGSIDLRALSALPPEEFMELSTILQMLTGGGNINSMQRQMERLMGDGSGRGGR